MPRSPQTCPQPQIGSQLLPGLGQAGRPQATLPLFPLPLLCQNLPESQVSASTPAPPHLEGCWPRLGGPQEACEDQEAGLGGLEVPGGGSRAGARLGR